MATTPLLILTHGEFGPVLLKAAEGMYGPQGSAAALGLGPLETREDFGARVQAAVAQLGAPPLVLVDLACGTPWNVAMLQGLAGAGEIMAGLSLPLLLEALGLRDAMDAKAIAVELEQRAPQTYCRASEMIAQGRGQGCA
jgi:mannose/fructose-specific phosphotransferase system component IIA